MNLKNLAGRAARRLKYQGWMLDVKCHPGTAKKKDASVLLFDTSMNSMNMGDSIIAHYCGRVLEQMLAGREPLRLPTHTLPAPEQLAQLRRAGTKIVCGTNLMTPHFEEFSNWKMPKDLRGYRDVLTLGVGWGYYCDDISPMSRFVYRTILSRKGLHSVRDGYTERKFREMGIDNVVNTGCPTLWGLTPEHCAAIPKEKSRRVITTLTDYDRDYDRDRKMIDFLRKMYDEVYVWIQGTEDEEYLHELTDASDLRIIPRSLEAYTAALHMGDLDYVGTRLHAGIHAMNLGVRTIILAVDNRAIEMGRDFHLPVIRREELEEKLRDRICGTWQTEITLPWDRICAWKGQFNHEK